MPTNFPKITALLSELQAAPLVAILRRPRLDIDVCAGALIEAGVRFVEITIDSPGAVLFLESALDRGWARNASRVQSGPSCFQLGAIDHCLIAGRSPFCC